MKVTKRTVTVKELVESFDDSDEDGISAYDGQLWVRPPYQREFVYSPAQQEAVIDTVLKGFPLGVMYWRDLGEDAEVRYELLDGQQRTLSICRYVDGAFTVDIDGSPYGFYNLHKDQRQRILDYELDVYVCEGDDSERLSWFRVINTAGEQLSEQELLNATYAGEWCTAARKLFSKSGCYALNKGGDYVKGDPIRQEVFEEVLKWAADAEGLDCVAAYMAAHQNDRDAKALKSYYAKVMDWASDTFDGLYDKSMKGLHWGLLYNEYKDERYVPHAMKADAEALLSDPDVTRNSGIWEYLLGDKDDERLLSIRQFPAQVKGAVWKKQGGKCAVCGKDVPLNKSHADHIVPWSRGGHTVEDNCQVLCVECNLKKGAE